MDRNVVIIADYRERTWDEVVRSDKKKELIPRDRLLSMELEIDGRYMDFIDLVNYSLVKFSDGDSGRHLVSKDDYVTLNGVFLSDYLCKRGYDVQLIRNFVTEKERLRGLMARNPLAVVVSTTFVDFTRLEKILGFIKECRGEETAIIVGGPTIFHAATYFPLSLIVAKSMLKDTILVVEKQGEKSLVALLDSLASRRFDSSSLCNVVRVDGSGNFVYSPKEPENNSLDENVIDWRNLPDECLAKVVPIRTSHGCPYRCAFCTFWMAHPRPMWKRMAHIAEELEGIKSRGVVKHIMITDDLVNVSREKARAICETIVERDLSVGWSAFLRSRPMDEEIVDLLRESNCKLVNIGFESFDDNILSNMNKRETVSDHIRCIRLLKEANIGVLGTFVFGFPGEDRKSLLRTASLINETGIDFCEVYSFIYYPYAAVGRKKAEFKLKGSLFNWRHYSMDSEELMEMMPEAIERIGDAYGLADWDNWSGIALLLAEGLEIGDIKKIFATRRALTRAYRGNDNEHEDRENLVRQVNRIITGGRFQF